MIRSEAVAMLVLLYDLLLSYQSWGVEIISASQSLQMAFWQYDTQFCRHDKHVAVSFDIILIGGILWGNGMARWYEYRIVAMFFDRHVR